MNEVRCDDTVFRDCFGIEDLRFIRPTELVKFYLERFGKGARNAVLRDSVFVGFPDAYADVRYARPFGAGG